MYSGKKEIEMKDLKNKNLVSDSNGVHVRISQGTPLYGNTEGFIFVL